MAAELFIGNLSKEVRLRDLENCFFRYGRIVRCDLKKNFGFVVFEDRRAAEEAIRKEDGRRLMGSEMNIEWAKGSIGDRSRRDSGPRRSPPPGRRPPPPRFRDRSPHGNFREQRHDGFQRRDSFRGGRDSFAAGRRASFDDARGRRDSFHERDRDGRRSFGSGRGSVGGGFDDRRNPRFDDRSRRGRGGGRRF